MATLPEAEKRRLVVEACEAAYAHGFIERLPNVSPVVFSVKDGAKQCNRDTIPSSENAVHLCLVVKSNA